MCGDLALSVEVCELPFSLQSFRCLRFRPMVKILSSSRVLFTPYLYHPCVNRSSLLACLAFAALLALLCLHCLLARFARFCLLARSLAFACSRVKARHNNVVLVWFVFDGLADRVIELPYVLFMQRHLLIQLLKYSLVQRLLRTQQKPDEHWC